MVYSNGFLESLPADATVPNIYHRAYGAVDPLGTGETSVNSLSRVLSTTSLPASTIDRVGIYITALATDSDIFPG